MTKTKTRRPAIAGDYFEQLTAATDAAAPAAPARQASATKAAKATDDRPVRCTVYLRPSLLDEARRAVVALGGPMRLTLTGLLEDALREKLAWLKKHKHGRKNWPPLDAPLKGGRPIKPR